MKERSVQFLVMIKCLKNVLIKFFISGIDWLCFKMGKNCYPQFFLEECKYIVKEKQVTRHITEELKISSVDLD